MAETETKSKVDHLMRSVDCMQAARMLELHGKNNEYFCPGCQRHGNHTTPFLTVHPRDFNCLNCGISGNVIDLVRFSRRMTTEQAIDWLSQRVGVLGAAEPAAFGSSMLPMEPVVKTPTAQSTQQEQPKNIRNAFLAACRKLDDQYLGFLATYGVGEDVVERQQLRCCGAEYLGLLRDLAEDYGPEQLLESGLVVERGPTAGMSTSRTGEFVLEKMPNVRPAFGAYHTAGVRYLIVPYFQNGEPVFFRAIALEKASALKAKNLPANLGGTGPCLYNVDAIRANKSVLLVRGEVEAMIAMTQNYVAVATARWMMFKPIWVDLFEGCQATVIYEEGRDKRVRNVASWFKSSMAEPPLWAAIPRDHSLKTFLASGLLESSCTENLPRSTTSSMQRFADDPLKMSSEALKAAPNFKFADIANQVAADAEAEAVRQSSSSSSSGAVTDRFIAALPAGPRRTILVYHRHYNGEDFIRWRYWYKRKDSEEWYRDEQMHFIIPANLARHMSKSLLSAANAKQLTPMPDWLKDEVKKAKGRKS